MSASGTLRAGRRAGRRVGTRLPAPVPAWAYFFDVDGTLADIVASPAHAQVDAGLRARIAALHRDTGGALALISGRTIADVDALFPGTRYPAAGQHGVERRSAAGVVTQHRLEAARLDVLRTRVAAATRHHAGIVVEDKGGSLALHYRGAPRLGAFVHRAARALAAELGPDVAVLTGKRVVELMPSGHDKGRAVLAFLDEEPFRGRRPVVVGDDVTDESAFAMVNRLGGVAVKVGPGPTVARWRLAAVADVRRWLEGAA